MKNDKKNEVNIPRAQSNNSFHSPYEDEEENQSSQITGHLPQPEEIFFSFSFQFFSTHIKKVLQQWHIKMASDLGAHKTDIVDRLNALSNVYTDIVTFPSDKGGPNWLKSPYKGVVHSDTGMCVLATAINANVSDQGQKVPLWAIIIDRIINGCAENGISLCAAGDPTAPTAAKVLQIESPIGSYKNRLLQYIYLYLCIMDFNVNGVQLLPIYISAAMAEDNPNDFREQITRLDKQLEDLDRRTLLPLLIIDNVRLFQCGVNNIYAIINIVMQERQCKIVVGADTVYSWNNERAPSPDNGGILQSPFSLYYHDSNGWQLTPGAVIKISSMNLIGRREEAINFINACIKYLEKENEWENTIDSNELYEVLIGKGNSGRLIFPGGDCSFFDLQFYRLDAYLLKKMLPVLRNHQSDKLNLVNLYNIMFFDSESPRGQVAENAFNYEYSREILRYDSDWWKAAKEHRSVLDYLISHYYWELLDKIRKCDEAQQSFSILPETVVLPKNVTRFLVQRINSDKRLIGWMVPNFKKLYAKLGAADTNYLQKSQILCLFGRITTDQKDAQIGLLKDIYAQEQCELSKFAKIRDKSKKEQQLFLLRTISVSLIYLGDEQAFCNYMDLILSDNNKLLFRSINRGFHLDYYGDISSYWTGELAVNLKDDPKKGINTFRKLYSDIYNKLNSLMQLSVRDLYVLTLKLVTFNTLIEERIRDKARLIKASENEDFRKQCLRLNKGFLDLIHNDGVIALMGETVKARISEVRAYILDNSLRLINNLNSTEREPFAFNEINALNTVRTGWKDRGILRSSPKDLEKGHCPESISAHMYQSWLIGYMFLPYTYHVKEYQKQTILDILLIHDLGEMKIGDISSGEKLAASKIEEENALRDVLRAAKDPREEEKIKLWVESEALTKETNINSRIAKEIDKIQALYQYCRYCVNGQIEFQLEQWKRQEGDKGTPERYWRSGIETTVTSEIGKRILMTLVLDNSDFLQAQDCSFKNAIKEWRYEVLEELVAKYK